MTVYGSGRKLGLGRHATESWSPGVVHWFGDRPHRRARSAILGGLFGKGGSAIATPLLAAIGVPPIIAVASPLPATIPGTLVAYRRYRRLGISRPRGHPVEHRSSASRRPSSAPSPPAGSSGGALVGVTDLVVAGDRPAHAAPARRPEVVRDMEHRRPAASSSSPPSSGSSPGCWPTPAASCSSRSTWPALKLPIKDGPGLLARRRGRARRPRHDRPRRPRPHRLDGDGRLRGRLDPAVEPRGQDSPADERGAPDPLLWRRPRRPRRRAVDRPLRSTPPSCVTDQRRMVRASFGQAVAARRAWAWCSRGTSPGRRIG